MKSLRIKTSNEITLIFFTCFSVLKITLISVMIYRYIYIENSSFKNILVSILILFLLNILAFSFHFGFEFDKSNNKMRKYRSFLGYSFGKWKNLPNFSIAKIYKKNISSSLPFLGKGFAGSSFLNICIKLYDNESSIVILETTNQEDAWKKLNELAKYFNLEIHDLMNRVIKKHKLSDKNVF